MSISLAEFRMLSNTKQIEHLEKTIGYKTSSEHSMLNKFNRFKIKVPGDQLEKMNFYIFFTKPDCNFFEPSGGSIMRDEIRNCYLFDDACRHYPKVFRCLQLNQGLNNFISPFYNHCESFQLSDRVIKTRDSVETPNDWKTVYGHRMNDSLGANTLNITFSDNRDLLIYHIIELWILYIDAITKGHVKPTNTNRDDKILDYACSIYFFDTSEDGESILYYRKYVGVFPLNIPDNIFSYEGPNFSLKTYDIQFQYSFVDTSPAVIVDFNNVNDYYRHQSSLDLFDNDLPDYTWCTGCYIVEDGNKWKLKWIE